ncbi:MAG: pyridoxal phosphate-dependent aminotransferase [Symploca sp. SIO1B1]|nr:pyridoxal phosphate-dependent aminotransferase [Symploca sp. SIO1B1]
MQPQHFEKIGNVLQAIPGRIDLRSFSSAYLSSFFPLEEVTAAFQGERLFAYSKTEGDPGLRKSLSNLIGVMPENLVVTDGAAHGLFLVILASLNNGDIVLVPRPVFPAYLRIVAYVGCSFEFYDWRPDGRGLIDRLSSSKWPQPKALIINSPHNPTGTVLNVGVYDEILGLAAAQQCLVIFDDVYAWLEKSVNQLTHLNQLTNLTNQTSRLVAIISLGKLLCLPGMRLGIVVAEDQELLNEIIEAKRHLTQTSCPATEAIAERLLLSSTWIEGRKYLLRALDKRRKEFNQIATQLGVRPVISARGFYAYASDIAPISEAAVDGIPGTVFESDSSEARYCLAVAEGEWTNFLRIARS